MQYHAQYGTTVIPCERKERRNNRPPTTCCLEPRKHRVRVFNRFSPYSPTVFVMAIVRNELERRLVSVYVTRRTLCGTIKATIAGGWWRHRTLVKTGQRKTSNDHGAIPSRYPKNPSAIPHVGKMNDCCGDDWHRRLAKNHRSWQCRQNVFVGPAPHAHRAHALLVPRVLSHAWFFIRYLTIDNKPYLNHRINSLCLNPVLNNKLIYITSAYNSQHGSITNLSYIMVFDIFDSL